MTTTPHEGLGNLKGPQRIEKIGKRMENIHGQTPEMANDKQIY